MSGIAGWVEWNSDLTTQSAELEAMGQALRARGPDEAGMWISGCAGLVHRRRAIVDRAGGSQPMVRHRGDQRFVITYNGELYNSRELRRKLELRGVKFTGYSDTEVVLAAFMEWGEKCLDRLNGIFAFGVWDEARRRLFLARDRIGVKPLFYARRGDALLFGSQLGALLAHDLVEPVIDNEGLAEIFVTGPMRTPGHGVFKDVHELKAAHYIMFDRVGMRIGKYWSLISQPHPDDVDTTVARVRELLQDTVERQLVSDVPVCSLLSGGLDSSAVAAFAARALQEAGKGPLHTYSVDYVGNDEHFRPNHFQPNSDAPYADLVSRQLGTVHHRIVLDTTDLADGLHAAVVARDLPGMADVDSSLLMFGLEIGKNHIVALSGEAADEVFGGYPWLFNQEALNANTFPWVRMMELRHRLLAPELAAVIRPVEYMAERYREALVEVPRLEGETGVDARMREVNYLNLTRFGGTLLERKDRMTAAAGLEARVPYCDHRLIEYVWNIPWNMKTLDGREKGLLRRSLDGLLPAEVVDRRKSPYPKTHNPAYLEVVRSRIYETLDDPHAPLNDLINVDEVKDIASTADSISLPFYGQLMTGPQLLAYLLQVDLWLREFGVRVI